MPLKSRSGRPLHIRKTRGDDRWTLLRYWINDLIQGVLIGIPKYFLHLHDQNENMNKLNIITLKTQQSDPEMYKVIEYRQLQLC